MAPRGITLYHSPASRAFTAYWMLEELGVPFRVKTVDIRKGEQKAPEYLKLNPAGKVPTVVDGEAVISENPAICIYLADRYGYGTLAPRIEDPRRGAYLKWMVYSTAVVEPVRALHSAGLRLPPPNPGEFGSGFGEFEDMLRVLREALSGRRYLLGAEFTAADVMLGAVISMSLYDKELPEDPVLLDYNARLTCREAYQRAADATWPKWLFEAS
ncbi:glutathione S-transferase family protein [Phenylobacterium sp.]|jgi:glutathione S-transferase|uniref:glutathione S-transferase family protein n=1 Tax=Phenylobacterium sp. TaxID=1871053 RepID=UPI002E30A121|nr:glutathione S-transferase family protein [Phenylobacterium sp.]HEX2559443.1 glutathione S-transferase family protein [Phenylobacterium sp.]